MIIHIEKLSSQYRTNFDLNKLILAYTKTLKATQNDSRPIIRSIIISGV